MISGLLRVSMIASTLRFVGIDSASFLDCNAACERLWKHRCHVAHLLYTKTVKHLLRLFDQGVVVNVTHMMADW